MSRLFFHSVVALVLFLAGLTVAGAQEETPPANDTDGASQQVEESDEEFRRRMELEDARYRDPTYTDPVGSYKRELEKIDKLPEESRDNIRDQLIDVIMANGEWEPSDALEEYPYTPTAAAQGDPKLAQQEQEAWEEQLEKYHERESEAFGSYRGPVQGPGNPDGPEGSTGSGQGGSPGGEQGEGQEGDQQGQQGQQGGQQGGQGQQGEQSDRGTYQPYQSSSSERSDAESRAGVSESALDFLMGRQSGSQGSGQPQGQAGDQGQGQSQELAQSQSGSPDQAQNQAGSQNQSQAADQAQDQQQNQQADPSSEQASQQVAQQDSTSQSEDSEQSEEPVQQDLRGILAIEDLDKLGVGTAPPPPPEEEEDDGDQRP